MTQLILVLIIIITIGAYLYITKYKNEGKPKVGIKRDNLSEYFKDYINLKLYWVSLCFIFFGATILIAILILELVFS